MESVPFARASIVDKRTSLQQAREEVGNQAKRLSWLAKAMKGEIEAPDASVKAHTLSDTDLAPCCRTLRSVPGIGRVNAAMQCGQMPELGSIGNRQADSLIGVAHFRGKTQGARHIRGGRRRPWEALFMAAMSAIRWKPDMTDLHDRRTARGKEHEVALVAAMRKLIVLVNLFRRQGREWTPQAPEIGVPICG